MRIVSIAAQTVRWPIAATGAARGRSERAAVLVEIRSDRGAIGLGEAAPLPGMSLDSLEDAARAIAAFARLAPLDLADPDAVFSRLALFEVADREAGSAPSRAARFALETALLDALAREQPTSLATLLATRPDRSPGSTPPGSTASATRAGGEVRLAAVVDDPDAARRAFAAGIRHFKIKIGGDDPAERAFAIAGAAPGVRLRIDGNRSWPRAEVAARLAALAALPIDYVEEPCRDAHLLLDEPLACKLALDESLGELTQGQLHNALSSPELAAVILKPTVLGGLSAALELAGLARRAGVAAVASHALEGPIGTAACAELALALAADHADGPAAGLAPHPALAGWSLDVPQLAADHVRRASTPGLGFTDLDLAGAIRACRTRRAGARQGAP